MICIIYIVRIATPHVQLCAKLTKMAGIHKFFKPISSLLHPSEMKIGAKATTEASTAVQNVLEQQWTRKWKAYTTFRDKHVESQDWVLCSRKQVCCHFEEVQEQCAQPGGEYNVSFQAKVPRWFFKKYINKNLHIFKMACWPKTQISGLHK